MHRSPAPDRHRPRRNSTAGAQAGRFLEGLESRQLFSATAAVTLPVIVPVEHHGADASVGAATFAGPASQAVTASSVAAGDATHPASLDYALTPAPLAGGPSLAADGAAPTSPAVVVVDQATGAVFFAAGPGGFRFAGGPTLRGDGPGFDRDGPPAGDQATGAATSNSSAGAGTAATSTTTAGTGSAAEPQLIRAAATSTSSTASAVAAVPGEPAGDAVRGESNSPAAPAPASVDGAVPVAAAPAAPVAHAAPTHGAAAAAFKVVAVSWDWVRSVSGGFSAFIEGGSGFAGAASPVDWTPQTVVAVVASGLTSAISQAGALDESLGLIAPLAPAFGGTLLGLAPSFLHGTDAGGRGWEFLAAASLGVALAGYYYYSSSDTKDERREAHGARPVARRVPGGWELRPGGSWEMAGCVAPMEQA